MKWISSKGFQRTCIFIEFLEAILTLMRAIYVEKLNFSQTKCMKQKNCEFDRKISFFLNSKKCKQMLHL